MTAPFRTAAISAIAVFAAGTASAELTAAQVWEDWKTSATTMGQTVSVGSEEDAGGTLTLRDLTILSETPEGGANITIAEVVMTPQGDGSVDISFSPQSNIDVTTITEGEAASFSVVIDQSALELVASGDPGAISYAYSAPSVTMTLSDATAEGQAIDLAGTLTITGVDGAYTVTQQGDVRDVASNLAAQAVALAVGGTDPEGSGDSFDLKMDVADITSESTGSVSALMGMSDLTQLVESGLVAEGITTHGPATVVFGGTGSAGAFTVNAAYDSGSYDMSVGEEGLDYGYSGKGFTLSGTSDQMPIPDASIRAEEIASRFAMPVGVSEEPGDLALALRLAGVTLSDQIWAMLDPMGVLPKDAANLILDVTGRGNWLIDVFDPAMADQPVEGMPGKVESVNVNELRLNAVGAELTGTGAFTVNNEATPPQPSGTLNLQLVGGNALLDKLVQMGLLPEDQAMGARMMLGLFARPGEGTDTLVSEITLQPDGAVLANGQRIR